MKKQTLRKQISVTIEGFTYELTQMGAVEGRELVILFTKELGRFAPLIASAVKAAQREGKDAIPTLSAASALDLIEDASEALSTLDPKQLEPFWDAFSRHTSVLGQDGKSRQRLNEVFDDHFAGEYFAMMRFFVEAAKLNFGDFLSQALGLASATQADAATP